MKRFYSFFLFAVFFLIILSAAVVLFFMAQQTTTLPSQSKKLSVTASFYPLGFLAQQIGGTFSEVKTIIPYGTEPHDFEPRAQDIIRVYNSDLFIYNGAGVDPWVEKIIPELNKKGVVMLNMSNYFKLLEFDPHIWLDPVYIKRETEVIRDTLVQLDSRNASIYISNAEIMAQKLENIHQSYLNSLQKCKLDTVVVSHNAFSYLAKRYGFKVAAISGLSPHNEPSSRTIAQIIELVKTKKIQYILLETLSDPAVAQVIADETGVSTLVLNPIEGITKKEAVAGEDYFSLLLKNKEVLQKARICQ